MTPQPVSSGLERVYNLKLPELNLVYHVLSIDTSQVSHFTTASNNSKHQPLNESILKKTSQEIFQMRSMKKVIVINNLNPSRKNQEALKSIKERHEACLARRKQARVKVTELTQRTYFRIDGCSQ
ncbi:hypothetical protein ACTXT7_012032 [Hymenolepis weldensis]